MPKCEVIDCHHNTNNNCKITPRIDNIGYCKDIKTSMKSVRKHYPVVVKPL